VWLQRRTPSALLEHFFAEAVDDHRDRVFGRQPALAQVEDLVLTDLDVDAFVFQIAVLLRTSMYGKVCAHHLSPMSIESHCE